MKELPKVLPDWDERALNGRINNKKDRLFLERDKIIATVLHQMNRTQTWQLDKPRAVVLWSPRGTGKTSLLRCLAKREEYAESYNSGRLLIIDANILVQYTERDSGELLRSMIIWHLLQLFDGYGFGGVALRALDFGTVIRLQSDPGVEDELKSWAQSLDTVDKAFQQWKAMTQTEAREGTPLMLFMDQTELLTRDGAGQSCLGGMRSCFTNLCSRLPQNMACFFVGTLNLMWQAPHAEYTRLKVKRVPALAPLSLGAAKDMMEGWKGMQYGDDTLKQIHLFSSGVPRLLQYAFQARSCVLSNAHVIALYEMFQCFEESYESAAPFLKEPAVALSLVLCSATRWPVKGACAPGTNKAWIEIFDAGAAFPAGNTVVVPRLWWSEDETVRDRLCKDLKENWKIFLEDLLPDPFKLVMMHGHTERGNPWERCVANALAARFRLHCIEKGLEPSATCPTWVSFLEIYPTQDKHLKRVLEPFEVCWCDGVEYATTEATVSDQVGYAIKANTDCTGAHHDLLIPVRRIPTQQAGYKLEYIAAQCRYGTVKGASDLAQQNRARRGDEDEMDNVLLQISDKAKEGKQKFRSQDWIKRQEKGKYALMNCKEIFSQVECLRIGLQKGALPLVRSLSTP